MSCLECTHSAPTRCSTCGGLEGYGTLPPCETCKTRGPVPTITPPPPGPMPLHTDTSALGEWRGIQIEAVEGDSGRPQESEE